MNVIKRDGTLDPYGDEKLVNAITKANKDVNNLISDNDIKSIVSRIRVKLENLGYTPNVELVQDLVEEELMKTNPYVARAYIRYRYDREKIRSNMGPLYARVESIVNNTNEEVNQENSNKDTTIIPTQRDYIAGEVSKELVMNKYLPPRVVDCHRRGVLKFHDADYAIQPMNNCGLVNLRDMLQNGTVISKRMIEKPHMFSTACTIATQAVAQVASSQYGGQTISLAHLTPFINASRQKYRSMLSEGLYGKDLDNMVEKFVYEDVKKGIQTIQYQLETISTTNGQAPFITIAVYINETEPGIDRDDFLMAAAEMFRQRTKGIKNEQGVYVPPAFPKIVYILQDDNINEDDPYYWLTEIAAECTSNRMVPDYLSEKKMKEIKGDVIIPMGCRSMLSFRDDHKYFGRFNQGVCTINLPYVALEAGCDIDKFWSLFDEYLEVCHEALLWRHEHLEGTKSDVAPILWQHGAYARLKPGETIDELLHNGYSTISLGYAGLYECVKALTGESHTGGGKELALKIMKYMNDKCVEWNEQHYIGFALYGTPLESTTYDFAKALKRFPHIDDVNDHNYITNSYHVSVRENIDAFTKLKFESEFQNLSVGGAISYIETPNMTNNIEAILDIIRFMYNNTMYAEFNTKLDYCNNCGFEGEVQLVGEHGAKYFQCPRCGCTDKSKLYVTRRTCGYIGTNFWNAGRTDEIADRVLHV